MTITLPRPLLADRTWRRDSACARKDVPADLWTADNDRARAAALHVCQRHCPVIADCDAEAQLFVGTEARYRSAVVGGLVYDSRGRASRVQSHTTRCPLCRRDPAEAWPQIAVSNLAPPCGTEAAYNRHRRRKEAIDEVCKQGRRARQRAQDRQCRYGICNHPTHRVVAS